MSRMSVPRFLMKVHHGGTGPSCLDLGKESGPTAILHPSHRAKSTGTGLCPPEAGLSYISHRCNVWTIDNPGEFSDHILFAVEEAEP